MAVSWYGIPINTPEDLIKLMREECWCDTCPKTVEALENGTISFAQAVKVFFTP